MRKANVTKAFIILSIFLMGCSGQESMLERAMLEKSGVYNEESYQEYQTYLANGKINKDGYYVDYIIDENSIHVTLAKQNKLDVIYYYDNELTRPIEDDECYLLPGSSIYASITKKDGVASGYNFDSFVVYEWRDNSSRRKSDSIVSTYTEENHEVLTIPENFVGKELSVEPQGVYSEINISLSDYYIDENGNMNELPYPWTINDKLYEYGDAVLNPTSPYIVSYEFDDDEYFYFQSSPECYYFSNEDGVVIFEQKNPEDLAENYSVELHKYIESSLIVDVDRKVSINGQNYVNYNAADKMIIDKLKYGDYVTLETDREWKELEKWKELVLVASDSKFNDETYSTEYKYVLLVPKAGEEFVFNPADYKYEHGNVVFECYGEVVSDIQYLPQGSRIYYYAEEGTVEEGYWLSDNFIEVGDEATTKERLNAIEFVERSTVIVSLKQPAYGGSIEYKVNGSVVSDVDYETYSGEVIEMNFCPWEGWMCNYLDGEVYQVNDIKNQEIKISGWPVDKAFEEDENHKPELTVFIDKSAGNDMKVDVFTLRSQLAKEESYDGTHISGKDKIVDSVVIGTESDIELAIKNMAIPSGKAIKITTTKKAIDKNTEETISYVIDLTKKIDAIKIYNSDEKGKDETWYKSIEIVIELVDIDTFKYPVLTSNMYIEVKNASTQRIYMSGDYIEPNEKVTFTITASEGYSISGKGVKDGRYEDSMKYSDFDTKMSKIIEEHPAVKN